MAEASSSRRRRPAAKVDESAAVAADDNALAEPAEPAVVGDEPVEPAGEVEQQAVAAAPLEPPAPRKQRGNPPSTEPFAASAGIQTGTGQTHVALIDADGDVLDPRDMFDDLGAHMTVLRVNRKVFQRFLFEGATTPTTKLYMNAGQMVPRDVAARIVAEYGPEVAAS